MARPPSIRTPQSPISRMAQPATRLFSPPRISTASPRATSKTSPRIVTFETSDIAKSGFSSTETSASAEAIGLGGQK